MALRQKCGPHLRKYPKPNLCEGLARCRGCIGLRGSQLHSLTQGFLNLNPQTLNPQTLNPETPLSIGAQCRYCSWTWSPRVKAASTQILGYRLLRPKYCFLTDGLLDWRLFWQRAFCKACCQHPEPLAALPNLVTAMFSCPEAWASLHSYPSGPIC